MYVFIRLAALYFKNRGKPRLPPTGVFRIPVRIWPNDLDQNWHVNNGRYLTLCDLGRFDLLMRSGLFKEILKRKWYPVLSSASLRFRKSLKAFDRIELTTEIIYWDEKWLYIEHCLEKDGVVCARGLVKGIFRGPEGNVTVPALMESIGYKADKPVLPDVVTTWLAFEATLREDKMKETR